MFKHITGLESSVVDKVDNINCDQFIIPSTIQSANRKVEFLKGRIALRDAVSKVLGENQTCSFEKDSDGVPILPDNIVASLTHKNQLAIAFALPSSDYLAIGADLELISEKIQSLKSKILTPKEEKFKSSTQITQIFSAKESLYKAIFPISRQFFGLQDASVLEMNNDFAIIVLDKYINDCFYKGREFRVYFETKNEHIISLIPISK